MWYVLLAPYSVLVQALGLLRVPTSCLRRPVAAYLLVLWPCTYEYCARQNRTDLKFPRNISTPGQAARPCFACLSLRVLQ
ncbi:hypothetical protein J3E68DRAFT_388994 [Trichoderma sp. SZMC 28012]